MDNNFWLGMTISLLCAIIGLLANAMVFIQGDAQLINHITTGFCTAWLYIVIVCMLCFTNKPQI